MHLLILYKIVLSECSASKRHFGCPLFIHSNSSDMSDILVEAVVHLLVMAEVTDSVRGQPILHEYFDEGHTHTHVFNKSPILGFSRILDRYLQDVLIIYPKSYN